MTELDAADIRMWAWKIAERGTVTDENGTVRPAGYSLRLAIANELARWVISGEFPINIDSPDDKIQVPGQ